MKINATYTPAQIIAALKDWATWTTPKNPNRYETMLKHDEGSPSVSIIFCKDYVRFSGEVLNADEKRTLFPYGDYDNATDFAQYLSDFIEGVAYTLEAEIVWRRRL